MLHIFLYLPAEDLSSIRSVSRFFYQTGNDNLLWKNNMKKYFPHYLPLLANDHQIDYKELFYKAMQADYQCTRQIGPWNYICQPFSIRKEVQLFNAAKHDQLDLFSKTLEAYDTIKKLEPLLDLNDQTNRTLFNWAGYFANQHILNYLFKKIEKLLTVKENIDYRKTINGITYYQYAALCNQINIIQQLTDEELQDLNSGQTPISTKQYLAAILI